jgi:ethanolaminephosphotransferase
MGFITKEGLKELDNYKYKPSESTFLDTIMNHYWEWCVKLVPMSVAPNVITFVGWCLVIASYANMLRYDYTLKE